MKMFFVWFNLRFYSFLSGSYDILSTLLSVYASEQNMIKLRFHCNAADHPNKNQQFIETQDCIFLKFQRNV